MRAVSVAVCGENEEGRLLVGPSTAGRRTMGTVCLLSREGQARLIAMLSAMLEGSLTPGTT